MRRVDRQTNALPDRPTDQPTDRPTDTASYRGTLSHLKIRCISIKVGQFGNGGLGYKNELNAYVMMVG